ncbi:YegP family protein [Pseudarthrobacter sp. PvP090]|uniref:YegP family protein n=1 Tax=Pseudarthrobacter sp. PvP090 TaxID=3156393 RepID=UPI0033977948
MAGIFEIAEAGGKKYFFKLTASDGTVVAVSPLFNTIKGAAAGINAVRENAATGLIVDKSQARSKSIGSHHAAMKVSTGPGARLAPS